ncbi:phosphorylase [Alienimonas sp. DA493]|uniref:phosphorylase family protein n=1 Tax=Alienimonas sp. DA493 TaxID=3373605 RepID=UPI0037542D24
MLLISALQRELPPQSGPLREVRMIAGGVGRRRAEAAAADAIGWLRPRRVVSIGYGGGLDSALTAGDVVSAHAVLAPDGEQFDAEPPGEPAALLATVDAPLLSAADKAALRERTGAAVVDMEAAGVAAACAEAGVPFAAVKVVTDAADDDLPAGLEPFLRYAAGEGSSLGCAGALLRRPTLIGDLIRLARTSKRCSANLAASLTAQFAATEGNAPSGRG